MNGVIRLQLLYQLQVDPAPRSFYPALILLSISLI